jgi:hypothetical protein
MFSVEFEAEVKNGCIELPESLRDRFHDGIRVRVTHDEEPSPPPQRPFVFGLHPGQVWMSDDFDAPLPDAFWLGEGTDEAAP